MAAGCPPMAWGVVMLHADEVPHRRRCCQVLALSQSPFSSLSPRPPSAPGTPLGPVLYNPRGALQPGIQPQAPRHFSCTCDHIVGLYSHSQTHQHTHTHTHTTTGDTSKRTMRNGSLPLPFRAQHNRPAPKHSLITIHSHMPAQRPPTIPNWAWHLEDLLPSFCQLRTSICSVALPLAAVSSAAPAKLVAPGWRNGGQSARSLWRQTSAVGFFLFFFTIKRPISYHD